LALLSNNQLRNSSTTGTVTLDKIREVVSLCKKHGISPMGSFMIGSPHETAEDVQKTIDFIKEIDLDQVGVCVTTPFPGTDIWEYGREKGLIKSDEWDDNLWGFHDIDEENLDDKVILADMDKETFFKMYHKLHNLSLRLDWKREIKEWLEHPYNLKLLMRHIKGRVKPYKKRLRSKIRKILKNIGKK